MTKKKRQSLKDSYASMPFRPRGHKPSVWSISPVRFSGNIKMFYRVCCDNGMTQLLFNTAKAAYRYAKANRPINTTVFIGHEQLSYWRKNSIDRLGWVCSG